LHAQCANVALRPPAFRLLHDYVLLRASAHAHRERGRSASLSSTTLPAGMSANAGDAPFQPYALGRLPLGDPWLDDEEANADDEADEAAVTRRRSSLASDGVAAGSPSGGSRSVLGKLYSSTFGSGAPKPPPTPDIVFHPKPLEVDPIEVDSEATSVGVADTGAVLAPDRESDAAQATALLLSLDGGSARPKAGGAESDGEWGGNDHDDDGLDAEYEFVASVALSTQSRLVEAGITLARASADLDLEWTRLELNAGAWRVAGVNEQYHLCPTYPTRLPVPASVRFVRNHAALPAPTLMVVGPRRLIRDDQVPDELLRQAAAFRSKKRLPVAVWRHSAGGNVMARSSQPNVGLVGNMSKHDQVRFCVGLTSGAAAHPNNGAWGVNLNILVQALVDAIRLATPKSSSLIIFDARSRLAAQVRSRAHPLLAHDDT